MTDPHDDVPALPQRKIDRFLSTLFLMKYWPDYVTPNDLSLFRLVVLGGFTFVGIVKEWYWFALIVFLLAGLLDALDGTLARVKNMTSEFGAQFDALSDKLVNVPVIILLALKCTAWPFSYTIAGLITFSAISLTVIRFTHDKGKSSEAGKWKMRLEVFGVALCLIGLAVNDFSRGWHLLLCHGGALLLSLSLVCAGSSASNHLR